MERIKTLSTTMYFLMAQSRAKTMFHRTADLRPRTMQNTVMRCKTHP